MPAETHQRSEHLDEAAVIEVITAVFDFDEAPTPDVRLTDLGIEDPLDVLDLWAAVAEELAERSLGELDVDDLEVATFQDLVQVFAAAAGAGARDELRS